MKSLLNEIAAVAGLFVIVSVPTAALAQYRCDQPVSSVDRRACEHAADGPDALRHFVTRTRMIYGLYIYDYLRDKEPATVAANTMEAAKPIPTERPEGQPTATAKRVH